MDHPAQYAEYLEQALQETWECVRNHQHEIATRMKQRADLRRKEYQPQIGDLVLVHHLFHPQLRPTRKQSEKYYGPYVIRALQGGNAALVTGMPPRVPNLVNFSYLKPSTMM